MIDFRLALRNLLGAGMKTWLNVIVLSMSFVIIIFYNGMMDGWNQQASKENVEWEYGSGQLWHAEYDPYDPFTLVDAHGSLPAGQASEDLVPQLIIQASIYPEGRMQNVLLKGIPADQEVLALPTSLLHTETPYTPILIGKRMARTANLEEGDEVLLRWRDKNGTFDAKSVSVAGIFDTDNPAVDAGQVWVDMKDMEEMTGYQNEATLFVAGPDFQPTELENWEFKDLGFLLADMEAIVQSKKGGMVMVYIMLLGIALLAIFDTQVLSIFRRQKEIGTYVALGMTRGRVVKLFTIEGGATSLLAAGVGAIYGVPLFIWMATKGIAFPVGDTGITMAERIFPVYGASLVIGTTLLVLVAATIVSYLPARKIAYMKPTEALKGKLQ
jgi:putative ABC transport system permease protein